METLNIRLLFLGAFILILSNGLIAQEASYNKLTEAFKTSYAKEAAKDYPASIKALNDAYAPDSYEVNLRLGWLNYLSANYSESVKYYKTAIELKPFAIEPKLGMAYPLNAQKNTQQLIKTYNQVLDIAPNNTYALYQLGNIYFNLKQFEQAEKRYAKVVDLFPFDYDALLMLAHTNFHLKKIREAKVLYHKVLLYSPSDQSAIESLKLLK